MVLAVLQDGGLVCARHRSCTGNAETIAGTVANDIELTLRAVFRNDQAARVRILLSGPDALCHGVAEGLSQRLRASSMPQNSRTPELDGEFSIALGLALVGLDPAEGRLNFLCADSTQVDRAARSKTKQAAFVSVALLAAILGLLGLRIVRELSALETEHARLNREIRAVFVNAFPGEKKIVNELAQMREHLNALRKQRNTFVTAVGQPIRPLWALQVLSETLAPDKGIRVSSFLVKDKSIDVAGTGDSFESVERLLARLREVPQFGSVELEDVASSRGSDRPEFRITISVKAG
jgi:Tfp pilus assembly protein PilN